MVKPFVVVPCWVLLLAALGGCSDPAINCVPGSSFGGDCLAAPLAPPDTGYAGAAAPAGAAASAASVGAARPASGGTALGDPASFADTDDRQCRSYGLVFGTHEYADCRIKLSAQHRGLDPNTGFGGAGNR